MPPPLHRETPWYEQAFDSKYLRVYAHRDEAEAERGADRLMKWLEVRPDDRVLDVACGEGRYARALARRGLRVTGIDLSPDLITEARQCARLMPGAPIFVRCDARRLPYRGQFESALSMFTSFGYFERRVEDLAIFQGVARALVPGGRLVVDFLNAAYVRSSLVAEEESERGSLRLSVRRSIDESAADGPRVRKDIVGFNRATGVREFQFFESVRLYTGPDVDAVLEEAGFELVGDPKGDLEGAAWGSDSPRYVRVAEIPAS